MKGGSDEKKSKRKKKPPTSAQISYRKSSKILPPSEERKKQGKKKSARRSDNISRAAGRLPSAVSFGSAARLVRVVTYDDTSVGYFTVPSCTKLGRIWCGCSPGKEKQTGARTSTKSSNRNTCIAGDNGWMAVWVPDPSLGLVQHQGVV